MQRDQTLDEVLLYKLPHVFEKLSDQERDDHGVTDTGHMTFLRYL